MPEFAHSKLRVALGAGQKLVQHCWLVLRHDSDTPTTASGLVLLETEHGLPMSDLEGKVDFYRGPQDRGKFRSLLRRSPNRFTAGSDGNLIFRMLKEAQASPATAPAAS